MNAADVMITDVITVKADATVQEVVQLLVANRISGAPVVDGSGKLVGIIIIAKVTCFDESKGEHGQKPGGHPLAGAGQNG